MELANNFRAPQLYAKQQNADIRHTRIQARELLQGANVRFADRGEAEASLLNSDANQLSRFGARLDAAAAGEGGGCASVFVGSTKYPGWGNPTFLRPEGRAAWACRRDAYQSQPHVAAGDSFKVILPRSWGARASSARSRRPITETEWSVTDPG